MFLPVNFHSTLRASLVGLFGLLLCATLLAAAPISFQNGRQAMERGDFAAALDIFQNLSQQQPGNPEVDFLLGRSAYESGDFETAIFAFERVLILQPQAQRARLELARSYLAVGDLQSARSNFQVVLDRQPPLVVRNNIQHYLEMIERAAQQHRVIGQLSIGLAYDDNVYKPGWSSSLLLYNSNYRREEDLNLNLFGLSSGPVWQQGNWQHKLQLRANYMTFGGDRYLSSLALGAEPEYRINRQQSLTLLGQISLLDFAEAGRDAEQYRLGVSYNFFWAKNRLNLVLAGEVNEADDEQYGYLRKLLTIQYQRQLPWRLTCSLGFRLQRTRYDAAGPLFSEKRRDLLREYNLGLSRPLWTAADGSRQLVAQLSQVWTDSGSNIDLYPYDKQVTSLVLSVSF